MSDVFLRDSMQAFRMIKYNTQELQIVILFLHFTRTHNLNTQGTEGRRSESSSVSHQQGLQPPYHSFQNRQPPNAAHLQPTENHFLIDKRRQLKSSRFDLVRLVD